MDMLNKLISKIKESRRIVFLGGAGVSTESGIPDFRGSNGLNMLNNGLSFEEILSHTYYLEHTEEFFDFYRKYMLYPDAEPNITHYTLAKLEKAGKLGTIITQNIDGLHEKARSRRVLNLHGSVYSNTCICCGAKYDLSYITESEGIPVCSNCGHTVKPDVVLYEENLDSYILNRAMEEISDADMLIVGGTSLNVYPAAGLINYFRGNCLVLINKSSTPYDSYADMVLHESLGSVFTEIDKEIEV